MAKKKFIAKAIKHPGALTRQAKAAHKSVAQFEANPGKHPSKTTKERIHLAEELRSFHKK